MNLIKRKRVNVYIRKPKSSEFDNFQAFYENEEYRYGPRIVIEPVGDMIQTSFISPILHEYGHHILCKNNRVPDDKMEEEERAWEAGRKWAKANFLVPKTFWEFYNDDMKYCLSQYAAHIEYSLQYWKFSFKQKELYRKGWE